jgi:NAD(P)-dependent dehydrogenase (short-subunit alcohol dehydrogenase family)
LLPLGKITEEHFDKLFDTNVKGTLFTVQKTLSLLNDGGSIILTGSVASVKDTRGYLSPLDRFGTFRRHASGLDQGELVTIPALADKGEWDRFEAAQRDMSTRPSQTNPAARYGIKALAKAT